VNTLHKGDDDDDDDITTSVLLAFQRTLLPLRAKGSRWKINF
jgi:hypothetical protein